MNNQIQLVLKSSTTELSLNDHELGIYLVPELDGLTGLPEIRTTSGVNSGYDGGWTSAQHYDARSITIRGVIANTDVATVERLRKQLVSLAGQGKQEELTLDLVTEAGNAYTLQVRTIALEMAMKGVLEKQEFMLQLRADDPLIYDNAESTHEAYIQVSKATGGFTIDFDLPLAITGGSEETVISNDGLEQVPTITRLYGELHNPKIINQTTNQSMQINADLGFSEGQWVDASEVVTGKTINIEDAPDNAPLASFRLDGETSQNGTPTPSAPVAVSTTTGENVVQICGKNLLKLTNGTYSSNGVTAVVNNGVVSLSGTATANAYVVLTARADYYPLTLNGSYKMTTQTTGDIYNVVYYGTSSQMFNSTGPQVKTLNGTYNNIRFQLYIPSGTNTNGITTSPMIIANGTDESFEPYQGQSYEVNLSLLPAEYQEVEYIESSAVTGQAINLKYYSTANTRFEIDYMRKSSMGAAPVFGARHDSTASDTRKMVLWAKDTTTGEAINFGSVDSGYVSGTTSGVRHVTSNIGANLYYNGTQVYTNDTAVKTTDDLPLYMFAMNSNGNADVRTNAIKLYSFKLYEDTTLTADLVPCYRVADNVIGLYDLVRHEFYQALGASTLSKGPNAANRAIELCKIGDYQDYIYKSDGKWYVHKAVGKYTFTGSEVVGKASNTNNNSYYYASSQNVVTFGFSDIDTSVIGDGSGSSVVAPVWSSHFNKKYPYEVIASDTVGIAFNKSGSAVDCRLGFGISSPVNTAQLLTTWLTENTPSVYYPLATPTDTEITNEALIAQLETLLNTARTYAGVNNIFTVTPNEQGTLEISYYTHKTADNRDEIVIDSRLRTVTLNGLDIYHLIETGSEFLMLAPGENKLSLQSDITGDNGYAEVSYKQGYLSI